MRNLILMAVAVMVLLTLAWPAPAAPPTDFAVFQPAAPQFVVHNRMPRRAAAVHTVQSGGPTNGYLDAAGVWHPTFGYVMPNQPAVMATFADGTCADGTCSAASAAAFSTVGSGRGDRWYPGKRLFGR